MSDSHLNNRLAALDCLISRAREAAPTDDLIRLHVLPAMQAKRDRA